MDDEQKAAYKARSKNVKRGPVKKLASDGSDIAQYEEREAAKAALDKRYIAEIASQIAAVPIDGMFYQV